MTSRHNRPTLAASLIVCGIGLFACGDDSPDSDAGPRDDAQIGDAQSNDADAHDATSSADATSESDAGPERGTQEYSLSRLDPDMREVIDQLTALGGKPIETLTPAEARMQPSAADAVKALLSSTSQSTAPQPVKSVSDRRIPGPGGDLPIRVYTPEAQGMLPLIVYYHGGGWVIATNDTYDATPRALSNAVQAIVVSVEYRKGPENKFPAAHDDAVAAYKWVLANAASLNADPSRIAVAGESAGGNLAAWVAIAARDEGVKLPVHALLVYPVASTNLDAPSYLEHAMAKPLNKAMIPWFTGHYLRSEADGNDPRISLVDAQLKGFPATTIINAEVDPLRSDGETLTERLDAAGVNVEHKTFQGVTHEFFGMAAVVADAKAAVSYAAERLRSGLTP